MPTIRVTKDEVIDIAPNTECDVIQDAAAKVTLRIGENARVRHYAFAPTQADVTLARDAFYGHAFFVKGATANAHIHVDLDGEGAETDICGLIGADGEDKLNHEIRIRHNSSHTQSAQYVKSVVDGLAQIDLKARIHIPRHVGKVTASQLNKNLLLSSKALVHTEPWLEIDSDDVHVVHGATIGQIDRDALMYLRSRGVDETRARDLLLHAFVAEVIDAIENDEIRLRAKSQFYA